MTDRNAFKKDRGPLGVCLHLYQYNQRALERLHKNSSKSGTENVVFPGFCAKANADLPKHGYSDNLVDGRV